MTTIERFLSINYTLFPFAFLLPIAGFNVLIQYFTVLSVIILLLFSHRITINRSTGLTFFILAVLILLYTLVRPTNALQGVILASIIFLISLLTNIELSRKFWNYLNIASTGFLLLYLVTYILGPDAYFDHLGRFNGWFLNRYNTSLYLSFWYFTALFTGDSMGPYKKIFLFGITSLLLVSTGARVGLFFFLITNAAFYLDSSRKIFLASLALLVGLFVYADQIKNILEINDLITRGFTGRENLNQYVKSEVIDGNLCGLFGCGPGSIEDLPSIINLKISSRDTASSFAWIYQYGILSFTLLIFGLISFLVNANHPRYDLPKYLVLIFYLFNPTTSTLVNSSDLILLFSFLMLVRKFA